MTTQDLLNKCIQKDRRAWDEFIRRYYPLVLKSVRYKLKGYDMHIRKNECDDIIQDIFLDIWENNKLSSIKHRDSLKGWLALVSINYTANYCRKTCIKNRNVLSLDDFPSERSQDIPLKEMLSSEKTEILNVLQKARLNEILRREISGLKPRQKLALKFKLPDGKKQKDIAAIMNIPESTVATLIKRAKTKLREKLKKILSEL